MDIVATPTRSAQERELNRLLAQAAQIEHLLAMEYLFAAFSLKKYPEEFDHVDPKDSKAWWKAEAQIERNRRWAAQILFVARQEMEHLAMVQNLYAILNNTPYLWRPNFPVPEESFPLGVPFGLEPLSEYALEVFRYYEKPESLHLPTPEKPGGRRKARAKPHFRSEYRSLQGLYEKIEHLMCHLLSTREIQGRNPNRVVNEHFGFNLTMDPLVIGQYDSYIHTIIAQILEEGEGVGEETPPLGSHFMAFQGVLNEYREARDGAFDPALPVVSNPTVLGLAYHSLKGTPVTNPHAQAAMRLFNDAYVLMVRMLTGFFHFYSIDSTTGIHPPVTNAFFQTAFYPFMTMIIRPLGEIVVRLPADADYRPDPHRLPARTAGPSFEIPSPQGPRKGPEKRASVAAYDVGEGALPYLAAFDELILQTDALRRTLPEDYRPLGARAGFHEALQTISENLTRMRSNFADYWDGKMVAPLPSRDFTNFGGPAPFN